MTSTSYDREQNPDVVSRWAARIPAICLLGGGIACIVASFLWSIPELQDLVQVHGQLQSYDLRYRYRGVGPRIVIHTDVGQCYTSAISEQLARELLRYRGTPVDFYVDVASRHSIGGIPAAYGLSVNQVEIQSPMAALAEERGKAHGGMRFCGAFFIVIAGALLLHSHQRNS